MLKMARHIALLFLLCLLAAPVRADGVGIVATINNDIITTHELGQRTALIMQANNLPPTDETRRNIAPEVLRGMIDDKLRVQGAANNGIKVSDEEIRRGLATLAGQNNMSVDDFMATLASGGIDRSTMEEQIRSEVAWDKYVQQRLIPRLNISEGEIDRLETQVRSTANQTSYLLAEIFLPVEKPEDEAKAKSFGDNLIKQIGEGTRFSALARSFSASASAARSGDLGWQTLAQMPPEIARIVKVMRAGQVSKPMRTLRGYYILYVRETRTLGSQSIPGRDQLREAATRQQLDLLQRRELRDLRSKAFIEVK
jgi:peptidyl-prolyl cis-trans isomerase SurA